MGHPTTPQPEQDRQAEEAYWAQVHEDADAAEARAQQADAEHAEGRVV